MADDNRFEVIGDQLEGEDATTDKDHQETDHENVTDESTEESTQDSESHPATEQTQGGPAFSFDESAQISIYPQTKTATDTLDDVEFTVEGILRREYDIRDLAGRELHDAMIRFAKEHPKEIAELIMQAREQDK